MKHTQKIWMVVCLALILTALAACGKKNDTAKVTPTEAATPTAEPTAEATPTEVPQTPTPTVSEKQQWYDKMIADSLMSTGNNARLKKVIERARNGEDIYIVTIGGSITEGAGAKAYDNCYAASFGKEFGKLYGKDGGANVHFLNAGLSGTPSTLGVVRYERDVIEKNGGKTPDILVIEFAVNDGDDSTNGQTYEGLVRRAMEENPDTAVILLFSVFQSKWNLQDRLKPIGDYYDLPMVSIKNAVVPRLTDGSLKDATYFDDAYHPTAYGHKIMRDCLLYLVANIDAEEAETANAMPTAPKMSDAFDKIVMVDAATEDSGVTAGGFKTTDKGVFAVRYEQGNTFPNNWKHAAADGDAPFTWKGTCRSLLLVYKKSSSQTFGQAEILVDGKAVKTPDGHDAGGWNNPYTLVLVNEAEAAEHTLTVRMKDGNADKEFTILAIGYGE
ncbi:MAG: SGNH/GDSL hydrolase family protein [Lachnospiraceae bacterium]|nr:SGNH/GDSL hydrolase family protein [Lachnospiraceae bacterium]